MPALLIEIDFISNSTVENNLASPKYIKDIADSISYALISFVDKSIIDEMSNANFYRVCIGAFKNKAISKGFNDTYII